VLPLTARGLIAFHFWEFASKYQAVPQTCSSFCFRCFPLLSSPPGWSVPWDDHREHAQRPGTGLWPWSWRGDKRPAWPWCPGSVSPPRRTKGRCWQQWELRLENFVLELLWVMNPLARGATAASPAPGQRGVEDVPPWVRPPLGPAGCARRAASSACGARSSCAWRASVHHGAGKSSR